MSSFSRSTFLLLIPLTLFLHSQTLAFSKNLIFHFPPFSNKNLLLLGSSTLRNGSLYLTTSLPSPTFGVALFLRPIPITPLVSFSTTFSFSAIKNSHQNLNFSTNNAISFFLVPNNSTHSIKNNSIFFQEFPISKHHKDSNFTLITATITFHYNKGGILTTTLSAGDPRIIIKQKNPIFLPTHFIYAGFLSSNNNNSESHVIKSWNLSSQTARRITLQSKKSPKPHHIINPDILIRATILASSAAIIILAGFNAKEHFTRDSVKRKKEKQSLLKKFRNFKPREIISGTDNFNDMIGRGGSARVYKMNFPPSSSAFYAVKRFSKDEESKQSYQNEVKTITQLQHDNILKLKGWCDMNSGENLLVYEYMSNGSLHHLLHSQKNQTLPWPQRYNIAIKLASALKHLHHDCSPLIVHGDVKSRNIMITDDCEPKLGDFGLSRVGGQRKAVGTSREEKSVFDEKGDVFSYGVVVMEICTGRMMTVNMTEGFVEKLREMEAEERLLEAADERLGDCFDPEEMLRLLRLGLACACLERERRPEIVWVLNVLNGEVEIEKEKQSRRECSVESRRKKRKGKMV